MSDDGSARVSIKISFFQKKNRFCHTKLNPKGPRRGLLWMAAHNPFLPLACSPTTLQWRRGNKTLLTISAKANKFSRIDEYYYY